MIWLDRQTVGLQSTPTIVKNLSGLCSLCKRLFNESTLAYVSSSGHIYAQCKACTI